jgi:CBS domain-containing membrane protein
MKSLKQWARGFVPAPVLAGKKERLYGCLGAAVGLFFAERLSKMALGELNIWFIAPMGASAVLLFAVPSSPLAQPWSLVGGNILSALIGITCAKLLGVSPLAAGIAVATAIGGMFALRCLHPPSGAVALMGVLGGPAILAQGYRFALWPVGVNSLFLLSVALLYNNALGRRYPHQVIDHSNQHKTADPRPSERLGFTRADLDEALKEHRTMLDIYDDDLEEIFLHAELNAYRRRSGDIRCMHVMAKDVITIPSAMTSDAALKVLMTHEIRALPVVDETKRLVGIVTLRDLVIAHEGNLIAGRDGSSGLNVRKVEEIMTKQVVTARPEQPFAELIPIFSDDGFHYLPIIDEKKHVVGIVTQSDLIAALYRARLEEQTSSVRLAA